jgi:hypothetical protein
VNGSNPANPPGRAVANRLLANVSAIWRSYHKRHGLPVSCPVERLTPGALKARDTRIDNHELAGWYAELHAKGHDGREVMSPIRRDLQLQFGHQGDLPQLLLRLLVHRHRPLAPSTS